VAHKYATKSMNKSVRVIHLSVCGHIAVAAASVHKDASRAETSCWRKVHVVTRLVSLTDSVFHVEQAALSRSAAPGLNQHAGLINATTATFESPSAADQSGRLGPHRRRCALAAYRGREYRVANYIERPKNFSH